MSAGAALSQLSVVIPVGPGDAISEVLRSQLWALPVGAQVHVVIASGAEAPDALCDARLASGTDRAQWRCHLAPPGRALQQNIGARAASGHWLWFLHADSQLAPDTLPALERFVHTQRTALGYFDLRFLADGPALMRLNALGTHIRSRWLGLPFGDQGLVLPRSLFERLGGFNESLQRGEDHDLVWRARHAGCAPLPVGAPLYTSARKYAQHGWVRTTAWHLRETCRQAQRFSRAGGDA